MNTECEYFAKSAGNVVGSTIKSTARWTPQAAQNTPLIRSESTDSRLHWDEYMHMTPNPESRTRALNTERRSQSRCLAGFAAHRLRLTASRPWTSHQSLSASHSAALSQDHKKTILSFTQI